MSRGRSEHRSAATAVIDTITVISPVNDLNND